MGKGISLGKARVISEEGLGCEPSAVNTPRGWGLSALDLRRGYLGRRCIKKSTTMSNSSVLNMTVHKMNQIALVSCLELLLLVIEMKAELIFEKFVKRKLIIN